MKNHKLVGVRYYSGGRMYAYRSQHVLRVGDRVVVDSPFSGHTVVTVVDTNPNVLDPYTIRRQIVGVVDSKERRKSDRRERELVTLITRLDAEYENQHMFRKYDTLKGKRAKRMVARLKKLLS